MRAGFGWDLGPFEVWDALGVEDTVANMEKAGYKPAAWVAEMLENGTETFYKSEKGKRLFYDIAKAKPINQFREPKALLFWIITAATTWSGKTKALPFLISATAF